MTASEQSIELDYHLKVTVPMSIEAEGNGFDGKPGPTIRIHTGKPEFTLSRMEPEVASTEPERMWTDDDLIEALAQAMWAEDDTTLSDEPWNVLTDRSKGEYRRGARDILATVRKLGYDVVPK